MTWHIKSPKICPHSSVPLGSARGC